MVNNLQIAFDRATKKYFDQSSSDEEQVLLEYPPVTEINNKTKRKIQTSDESLSKNDEIKHTKYIKKETVSNSSVSEKKSAKKIEDKVNKKHKNAISKLESSSKNTKRKKDKDKDNKKDKNHKVIVENSENDEDVINDDEDSFDEVKTENRESNKTKSSNKSKNNKKTNNNFPMKEVKVGKKYNKKKIKTKEKVEKKLPKSYNKKAKNNKKIGNAISLETDIKSVDAFKKNKDAEDAYNTDFSSDESIRDLINESFTKTSQSKKEKDKEKVGKSKKAPKESTKKGIEKISKQIKKNKHKISTSKINLGCLDDDFTMLLGTRDKEKSPALLSIGSHSNDTTSFSDLNKSSTSFEIKDKFDLIKERRNQKNLLKEKNDVKTSKKSKKAAAKEAAESVVDIKLESPIIKEKSSKDKQQHSKAKKEVKDLFDALLEDRNEKEISSNNKNDNNKTKSSSANNKESEKSNKLFNQDISSPKSNDGINKKKIKQKATLDVLDLETEQTLKDINKWLEHTPRFEYNSESNSPSRYTIDDMDVHLKSDNNDFRKPIPLMPSSPPSTSKKIHTTTTTLLSTGSSTTATFQNIVQKNEKDNFSTKDIVDNNNSNNSKDNVLVSANLANKKFAKLSKKKLLGDKHQIVMKTKREIQRTTNRLQPGKTKGNLLCNLQNVMKPDEFITLGNKEKVKDVKNSLITETDENSPKLNLGKVLDPSTFHFNNSGELEKEEPINEHNKNSDRNSDDEIENSEKEQSSKCRDAPDDEQIESSLKAEPECSNTNIIAPTSSTTDSNAKPNLSAWFKAFGVSKKPNNSESENNLKKSESKNDILLMPQRRLSTGSSVSEISSVESSPHISMEDRSAPAPFPSPIAASPISAISPKLDDIHKTNYPDNGPIRVGFYQDTTSTKSSPDKSHSPQEQPLSSPYQQYSQQSSNVYSSQSANVYSNFYNPESSSSTKQHQSSSNSPLYYDQYNKHFNQESSMHKSMNSSVVSPGSSHHSQQSSPYQQQPNSPYPPTPDNISTTEIHQTNNNNNSSNNSSAGNNSMSNIQSPSSTYSQSNSPYHQNPTSPYHSQQSLPTNQNNFNNQITPQSNMFEPQPQEVSQFSPNPQQPHVNNASQKAISSNNNFNPEIRQTSTVAPIIHNTSPMQQQQHPNFVNQAAKTNETPMSVAPQIVQQQQQNQQILYPGDASFLTNEMRNKKLETGNETMFSSAGTRQDQATLAYQEEVRRQAALQQQQQSVKQPCNTTVTHDERQDNPKYLDLSKQANRFPNQYLASNFSQPLDLDFTKNRTYDTTSRNVQKPTYPSTLNNCQLPNDSSVNNQQKLTSVASQLDIVPKENPKQSTISNFIQNPSSISVNNDLMSSHQSARTAAQPSAIDMNYKQASIFNSSSASSMMELTAFMRDFRQAEDRFASISNPSTNYYDKTNPAAHMFSSKNVPPQSSATTNFQQIYSNPMTTIAYGREQQDFSSYQSRLNIFQASNNTNQMMNANQQAATTAIDTKGAKKGKKKKNAVAEVIPQQTSHHQLPATNQQQAHQQYVHQQTFQSFPGIKVPSASSSDSSSLSIKSVVPGSAFNYGPPSIPGLYGDNSAYLEEFRGSQNPYYSSALRTAESIDKTVPNPPQAHPTTPSSPYHHLLPSHPSRSYPFMNSIDPAALQQQYRMMFNQSYQAGYHLGMHQQPPPHWHM